MVEKRDSGPVQTFAAEKSESGVRFWDVGVPQANITTGYDGLFAVGTGPTMTSDAADFALLRCSSFNEFS